MPLAIARRPAPVPALALLCAIAASGPPAPAGAAPQALDDERPPEMVLPEGPREPSDALCFRGADLGHCSSFWLVESALLVGDEIVVSYSFGMMKNMSFEWALGAAVFVDPRSLLPIGVFDSGGGVRPRLRYWLDEELSIEAAPGLLLWSSEDDDTSGFGFSGTLALRVTEQLGAMLQVDALPESEGSDRGGLAFYGGLTLGAEAGAIGMAVISTFGVAALFGLLGAL